MLSTPSIWPTASPVFGPSGTAGSPRPECRRPRPCRATCSSTSWPTSWWRIFPAPLACTVSGLTRRDREGVPGALTRRSASDCIARVGEGSSRRARRDRRAASSPSSGCLARYPRRSGSSARDGSLKCLCRRGGCAPDAPGRRPDHGSIVKGHQELPKDGQLFSRSADNRIPCRRTGVLPCRGASDRDKSATGDVQNPASLHISGMPGWHGECRMVAGGAPPHGAVAR